MLAGCGSGQNMEDNQLAEGYLKKEQELLAWENRLKLKDQELKIREQRLDSIEIKKDTLGTYNAKLIGNWSVRMRCTETTCAGSAIGDTKTEQWNISYENNKVVVKASSNKVPIRTYKGIFKDNNLKLTALQSGDSETIITITLREVSDKRMEGTREIYQAGICKIIYALEIERS